MPLRVLKKCRVMVVSYSLRMSDLGRPYLRFSTSFYAYASNVGKIWGSGTEDLYL